MSIEGHVGNETGGEAWLWRARTVLGYELTGRILPNWCEGQALYRRVCLYISPCIFRTKQFSSAGLVFPAKSCLCVCLLLPVAVLAAEPLCLAASGTRVCTVLLFYY